MNEVQKEDAKNLLEEGKTFNEIKKELNLDIKRKDFNDEMKGSFGNGLVEAGEVSGIKKQIGRLANRLKTKENKTKAKAFLKDIRDNL